MQAKSKTYKTRPTYRTISWAISIIIMTVVFIAVGTWYIRTVGINETALRGARRGDRSWQQNDVATALADEGIMFYRFPEEYREIERTQWLVAAAMWLYLTDANGDGVVNIADAAILFYHFFPNRRRVRIMRNDNIAGYPYLFNAVLFDREWRTVDPLFDWSHASLWMADIWGEYYNPRLSRNETRFYRRYVR